MLFALLSRDQSGPQGQVSADRSLVAPCPGSVVPRAQGGCFRGGADQTQRGPDAAQGCVQALQRPPERPVASPAGSFIPPGPHSTVSQQNGPDWAPSLRGKRDPGRRNDTAGTTQEGQGVAQTRTQASCPQSSRSDSWLPAALANTSRNNDDASSFHPLRSYYAPTVYQHFTHTTGLNSVPTAAPGSRCFFPFKDRGLESPRRKVPGSGPLCWDTELLGREALGGG